MTAPPLGGLAPTTVAAAVGGGLVGGLLGGLLGRRRTTPPTPEATTLRVTGARSG